MFGPDKWQHRKMVQNNYWSRVRMSSATYPFWHFLERIMSGTLEEHGRRVGVSGWSVAGLQLTDGMDALRGCRRAGTWASTEFRL